MSHFLVRVPATTANLGPGFDVLGLALDLWNEVEVNAQSEAEGLTCRVAGFGKGQLPENDANVVLQAARRMFEIYGPPSTGLHFTCRNRIPPGSGLGSSSAAILSGLLAANKALGLPAEAGELLNLAAEIEGHPDNVTPGLLGGLTISATIDRAIEARMRETAPWWLAAVVPDLDVPTEAMRAALPAQIPLEDAVFNLGRAPLVVEALVAGDLPLLRRVMEDRLHQPYRMPLIPGTHEALDAAFEQGGSAALSGAGPGVVAFAYSQTAANELAAAMTRPFSRSGLDTWNWVGGVSRKGGYLTVLDP